MAETTVRSARPEEAEAIRAVGRAAWHAAYDPIHGPGTVEDLFDSWWSAEDLREGVFGIGRLYVHPAECGERHGTRLVDALRERLPDGVRRLRVVVLAGNEVGVPFYESYGFGRVGRRVEERDGEEHEEYVYELPVR